MKKNPEKGAMGRPRGNSILGTDIKVVFRLKYC